MKIEIVLISFLLTECFLIIAYHTAKKLNIIDIPNERKIHTLPTPRAGGIAIFLTLITLSILSGKDYSILPAFLISNLIIFSTGIFDDKNGLSPWNKLLLQFLAATIIIFFGGIKFQIGGNYSGILNLNIIATIITYLWIIGAINALNLIDGMDGLAGGISFFAFGAILFISFLKGYHFAGFISLILLGSIISFLNYNLPSAKMFLGDSGSMLLGFNIAVLSLLVSYKTGAILSIIFPSLFVLIPVADTIYAFFRRLLKGKNPLTNPDNQHIHHRLLLLKFSHNQALIIFYFFTGLFTTISINLKSKNILNGIIISLGILLLLFISIYFIEKNKLYLKIEKFNQFTSTLKKVLLKENGEYQTCLIILRFFIYSFYILSLVLLITFGKIQQQTLSILFYLLSAVVVSVLISIFMKSSNNMLAFLEYWIDLAIVYILYLNNLNKLIIIFSVAIISLLIYRIFIKKRYALLIPSPEDIFLLFTIVNIYLIKQHFPFLKTEYFFFPLILYIARKTVINRNYLLQKKYMLTKALIFLFFILAISFGFFLR